MKLSEYIRSTRAQTDLDEKVVSEVEGANRVDEQHFVVMIESDECDLLEEIRSRRVTGQVLDLFCKHMTYVCK